jgi:hypothetical protein
MKISVAKKWRFSELGQSPRRFLFVWKYPGSRRLITLSGIGGDIHDRWRGVKTQIQESVFDFMDKQGGSWWCVGKNALNLFRKPSNFGLKS